MGIAIGSDAAAIVVIVIGVLIGAFVGAVNWLQARHPEKLPEKLRTWAWLPEPLRSLEPYDKHIFGPLGKMCICCKACKQEAQTETELKSSTTTSSSAA